MGHENEPDEGHIQSLCSSLCKHALNSHTAAAPQEPMVCRQALVNWLKKRLLLHICGKDANAQLPALEHVHHISTALVFLPESVIIPFLMQESTCVIVSVFGISCRHTCHVDHTGGSLQAH